MKQMGQRMQRTCSEQSESIKRTCGELAEPCFVRPGGGRNLKDVHEKIYGDL
jgi:hypothetical protein